MAKEDELNYRPMNHLEEGDDEQFEDEYRYDPTANTERFDSGNYTNIRFKEKKKPIKGRLYAVLFWLLFLTNIAYFGGQELGVWDNTFPIIMSDNAERVYFDYDAVANGTVTPQENYDDDLLRRMGAWMQDMGYTDLTDAHLAVLRDNGVTATYTNGMHNAGFEDATLNEITRMRQRGVSTTFANMMTSLGYELTVDEIVRLENNDVTAYFTSNMHDLGYTDITVEELIRLKSLGVTTRLVETLINRNGGEKLAIEEIARYRISNQ